LFIQPVVVMYIERPHFPPELRNFNLYYNLTSDWLPSYRLIRNFCDRSQIWGYERASARPHPQIWGTTTEFPLIVVAEVMGCDMMSVSLSGGGK